MVKEIIIGTDLIDDIKKYDVILVGTSIKNTLGNGFQHKIARNFPEVSVKNKQTKYDDVNKLGTCQVITSYVKDGFPIFVLCYITKGRYRPDLKPDTLDYDALESCLSLIEDNFKGKKVATTLLGNSNYEAGGDAKKIYEIIGNVINDVDLYIYDYIQEDYRLEDNRNYKQICNDYKNKLIDKDTFYQRKKDYILERKFGKYLKPSIYENMGYREMMNKLNKNN